MLSILNSIHSFVRFDEVPAAPLCVWGDLNYCLPVFADEDVYFQFIIQGTEAEIDSLCIQDASEVEVSLVLECGDDPVLIFDEKPQRFRLSPTQVIYNWEHGLPGFGEFIDYNQCFKIQVKIDGGAYGYLEEYTFCSNCFERIQDDCFTSVIEYTSDEDTFGFKYCYAGDLEGETQLDCSPTIVPFIGIETLVIPYTAGLIAKYGVMPTVQVWVYDGSGQLINMGITAGFDTYPPTLINLDFGGVATGIVVIR